VHGQMWRNWGWLVFFHGGSETCSNAGMLSRGIERTPNNRIPVYRDIRNHNTRELTIIRKVMAAALSHAHARSRRLVVSHVCSHALALRTAMAKEREGRGGEERGRAGVGVFARGCGCLCPWV
jgi:hypothetical protein